MIFLYTYLFFVFFICLLYGQAHNYIVLKKNLSKDTKIVCNKYAIKVFLLYFFTKNILQHFAVLFILKPKCHYVWILLSLYFKFFAYMKTHKSAVYARSRWRKQSCYSSLSYIFSRVDNISQPDETRLRSVNADQCFHVRSRLTASKWRQN